MSKSNFAAGAALVLIGVILIGYAFALPTTHADVTATKIGTTDIITDNTVPYNELSGDEQTVFRNAMTTHQATTPSDALDTLNTNPLVTLDGNVYRVTATTGQYVPGAILIGFFAVVVLILGLSIIDRVLARTTPELQPVFIGSVGVIIACIALAVIWVSFGPPLGETAVTISTTPVTVSDTAPSTVIHVSSLPEATQHDVYSAVTGGEPVTPSTASFTSVSTVDTSIADTYTYVQSNSEYYQLSTTSNHYWFTELFILSILTVFTFLLGGASAAYAYDTTYFTE